MEEIELRYENGKEKPNCVHRVILNFLISVKLAQEQKNTWQALDEILHRVEVWNGFEEDEMSCAHTAHSNAIECIGY